MDCYNCGAILNRKTRSAEHILPNSIGGKRKAYNLLCKSCNEKFGRSIDNELASKLARFYSLLQEEEPNNKKDGKIAAHDRFLLSVKKNRSFDGSVGYFRSIAKICLNYYLSKGYARQFCEAIKTFIRGENENLPCFYYAPESPVVSDLADDEVSHIIHLHGSKETGLLYAYIELFNVQNLVVIFSKTYDGEDINATYSRDIIRDEETNRKVSVNLKRGQTEQLESSSAAMEEKLFPRFERLLQIIQNR